DRAFGKAVFLDPLADARHQKLDAGGVLPDHRRLEIRIDGQLHALRALAAIGEPTDRRSLTDADDAVAAMDFDQHQALTIHRRDGELVRPDGRQVDQQSFHPVDNGGNRCVRRRGCEGRVHARTLRRRDGGRPTPFASQTIPLWYYIEKNANIYILTAS